MSPEKVPKYPDVQNAINGMYMLIETDKYFNDLQCDTGVLQGEILQEEALLYLGQVATAMVKSCNDKDLRGCQVFRALHVFYKGPAHHAALAENLIYNNMLDVSGCQKDFCMLKSIASHR